jgi:hypothetical protein
MGVDSSYQKVFGPVPKVKLHHKVGISNGVQVLE